MKRSLNNYPVIATLVLAFLVNAIAPVLAAPDNSGKVLLCSAQGYKWVNLDADGNIEKESSAERCFLCLAADDSVDQAIIESVTFSGFSLDRSTQKAFSQFPSFKARFLAYFPHGRAPPHS